jgi:hypothetical protein
MQDKVIGYRKGDAKLERTYSKEKKPMDGYKGNERRLLDNLEEAQQPKQFGGVNFGQRPGINDIIKAKELTVPYDGKKLKPGQFECPPPAEVIEFARRLRLKARGLRAKGGAR